MKLKTFLLFFILLTMSVSYAFDEKQAKAIFESRCSICHSLELSLETRKTKEGWRETINRMRKKTAGNVISSEDVNIITEYLFRIRGK